ncbi:homoserine/homoserine lactone efflux protein [Propionivibrio sp.]|uniref:homoserine/homoserine lactone efflux protein n=1 Tax=Propionivibrio sp. TaxID=2212460 RepID=UPI003BF3695D
MTLSVWLGFLLAAILIAISPGPGAAASMSTGLRYGYWSALRVILGLQAALLIQLLAVAVGLGALLQTSALAFNIVKLVGAAYLIWLGIQKWRAAPQEIDETSLRIAPNRLFIEGLLVNLTNPKAIVFIAALTPQFIDPALPQWSQFLVIGLTMCGVDMVVMSCYALLASRLRGWLHDARSLKAQNRFFGGVFVGAGVLLASSGQH